MIIWVKNKNLKHFLSIHRHSYKHAMHLFDIAGKVKDQRRKSKSFPDKPSFLKRIRRSIVARINIQFWKYAIPFGSINPESRIFLRFRSGATTWSLVLHFLRFRLGASTRSLVSTYDSVREHQPRISYLPTISFGSNNPESRITFPTIPFGSINPESRIAFPTIPFGSINPESRIFLRFRSGVSTRSLVFFLQFHSRNVISFRIKVLEEN